MSDTTLRRATESDVAGIENLAAGAFGKYTDRIGRPPAPIVADYAELLGNSRVWVIDAGDRLVGMLVTQAKPGHLYLDSIAVDPASQGTGVGGRLLRRAEADCHEQGLGEIRLCTNEAMTENLDFYPRQGYRETGRGIEDGYRRVFYTKVLTRSEVEHQEGAGRGGHHGA
jgi:ribosomal protein S18 acetylase RimI-like enzyme